jgi:hypothetical protein
MLMLYKLDVYTCVYMFTHTHTHIHTYIYIYIKSKGIYQPENLMSNGSSRHDDAAQTSENEGVQDF